MCGTASIIKNQFLMQTEVKIPDSVTASSK